MIGLSVVREMEKDPASKQLLLIAQKGPGNGFEIYIPE